MAVTTRRGQATLSSGVEDSLFDSASYATSSRRLRAISESSQATFEGVWCSWELLYALQYHAVTSGNCVSSEEEPAAIVASLLHLHGLIFGTFRSLEVDSLNPVNRVSALHVLNVPEQNLWSKLFEALRVAIVVELFLWSYVCGAMSCRAISAERFQNILTIHCAVHPLARYRRRDM